MEFTYKIALEDLVAFNRFLLDRSSLMRVAFFTAWLVVPFLCLISFLALVAIDGYSNVTLFLALVGGLFLVVFPLLFPLIHGPLISFYLRLYMSSLDLRGMVGAATLIFTDESVLEVTERTRSEYPWKSILSVETTDDHAFLFVTGISALVLPRKGFADESQFYTARDFALSRFKAQGGPNNEKTMPEEGFGHG